MPTASLVYLEFPMNMHGQLFKLFRAPSHLLRLFAPLNEAAGLPAVHEKPPLRTASGHGLNSWGRHLRPVAKDRSRLPATDFTGSPTDRTMDENCPADRDCSAKQDPLHLRRVIKVIGLGINDLDIPDPQQRTAGS
ncbi:hypothetical protein DSY2760 [Desulfitobacterium hafniense Y51]|uniref:Uncharacterized protein n=1 Tax=Desulfitobacterium hafniense (strain Y51) TaxID=138119 RepID=Q24TU3_DESHY|nr:hypothetical protein DSY2760 [Desulfitobacterium hafniense Y51]